MNEVKSYGYMKIISDVELSCLPHGQAVMNFMGSAKDSLGKDMKISCSLFGDRAKKYHSGYSQGDIVSVTGLWNAPKLFYGENGAPYAVNSLSLLSIFMAEAKEE